MAQISGSAFSSSALSGVKNLTLPKIERELHDAIYDDVTLIRKMREKGGIVTGETGDGIYIQLTKSKEDTFGSAFLNEPYPIRGQDTRRPGYQDYGQYVGSLAIDYVTEQKNAGKEALIKYITEGKNDLIKRAKDVINTDLYSGSGSSPSIVGLETLIAETPSTGTIHGIDRSTQDWFRNKSKDSTVNTTQGFSLVGLKDIDVLIKEMSTGQGMNPINLAICDDTVHSNITYYGLAVGNARTIVSTGSDIPATGVKLQNDVNLYVGNAELIWDHNCSGDSLRLFSTDLVKLHILKNCDFKMLPAKYAEDSFSKNIPLGVVCALVNHNPRHSGVLYNFSS
jgi:hypothetical protein